jgi:hypothetical protein
MYLLVPAAARTMQHDLWCDEPRAACAVPLRRYITRVRSSLINGTPLVALCVWPGQRQYYCTRRQASTCRSISLCRMFCPAIVSLALFRRLIVWPQVSLVAFMAV